MRNLWRRSSIGMGGTALAVALSLGLASPSAAQTSGYLDFDGLTAELQEITGSSNLARMMSIAV